MTEQTTKFEDMVLKSYPTGSRYICNPPPKDTDNDTVMLVNGYHDWQTTLIKDGWEPCGDYEFAGRFSAFRKGQENYICTEDEDFFNRYVFATEGAKALNLLVKEDRIKLSQSIADAGQGYIGFRVVDPLKRNAINALDRVEVAGEPVGQWNFDGDVARWERIPF